MSKKNYNQINKTDEQKKSDAIDSVQSLFLKYADDPYMFSKMHNHLINHLPNLLETMKQTHIERTARITELTADQDLFIQSFLTNNQYFYMSSNEKFFCYDRLHYQYINDDDVLYRILSSISRDRHLMSWKQKTKINIMKRIREEQPLLKSIPESETIQFVMDLLCPVLFTTRTQTKYFLTILGDNILKKNTHLIHFINLKSKQFIQVLNNACLFSIGIGATQTFRHKFHEHDYQNCRVLTINDCVKSEHIWRPIQEYILDIICVACHYSSRFSSSDEYIESDSNDNILEDDVFFLKRSKQHELIELFMYEYLDISVVDTDNAPTQVMSYSTSPQNFFLDEQLNENMITQITWKNMQYLWKHFLDSKQFPAFLYMGTLKAYLIDKLSRFYKEEKESFFGICCRYLPAVQTFIQFWEETVVVDNHESGFEVEELHILYRNWCFTNDEQVKNITSKRILDVILYFYPNTEITQDKFIANIRNVLWDKRLDISIAMDNYKLHLIDKEDEQLTHVSIYDAYLYYSNYYKQTQTGKQIVSKSYFEKYILENYTEYVIDAKLLSYRWWQNSEP